MWTSPPFFFGIEGFFEMECGNVADFVSFFFLELKAFFEGNVAMWRIPLFFLQAGEGKR